MASTHLDSTSRASTVADLFQNWELLRRVAATYGDVMTNRWMRMGANKRRSALLAAFPSIPAPHRPDIVALRSKTNAQDQQQFFAPAINLEDLVKPRLLPLMIQSRASHPPSAFVDVDFNATRLGWVTEAFKFPLQTEDVMLFRDRDSASDYAEIVTKEANHEEYTKYTKLGAMDSEQGAIALRAQQYIYQFLAGMCRRILHDKDFEQLDGIDGDLVLDLVPLNSHDTELLDLSMLRLEAPYRVPVHLDLTRLRTIVGANSDAAKERLIDLVENPGEFASYLQIWRDHRLELVLDYTGVTHLTARFSTAGLLAQSILAESMQWAIDSVDKWAGIEKQLSDISELMQEHAEKIQPSLELPKDLTVALLTLQSLLNRFAQTIISHLRIGFPSVSNFWIYSYPYLTNWLGITCPC